METLTIGTIEYLLVDVTDLLDEVDDLTTANPRYFVYDPGNNLVANNLVGTAVALPQQTGPSTMMRIACLINSTVGGLGGGGIWVPGPHKLYLRLTVGSEVPFGGPFTFMMVA